MRYRNFDEIVAKLQNFQKRRRVAVAAAADEQVIEAVFAAMDKNIADPVLVGDRKRIRDILQRRGWGDRSCEIIHAAEGDDPVQIAVNCVNQGKADFLMKGLLDTKDLLKAVVNKDNGLHLGRVMSHIAIFQLRNYHKLLFLTDGGMCMYPDLAMKKEIVLNAVNFVRKLGCDNLKVGVLAAVEKVNPKMPETMDAKALQEMNERGEISGCTVEGPVSYDIAMSKEIARIKKYPSPNAGDFDILVAPDIHVGNAIGKCLIVSAGAEFAGVVAGAEVPVILASRGSSAEEKFYSLAVAALASV